MLEIVQINLQHSKVATASLVDLVARRKPVLVLIQEPWLNGKGVIQGLKIKGYVLCQKRSVERVRSCILIRKEFHFSFLDEFSDGDCTTITMCNKGGKKTCICSAYFPGDNDELPDKIIKLVKHHDWDVLIGCDANAHHTQWGCLDTNPRGELVFDFIIVEGLNICNVGNTPTFHNAIRSTILDLTLTSNSRNLNVRNWRVSSEESLSDHSWIIFQLDFKPIKRPLIRNPRKANWDVYETEVRRGLQSEIGSINTIRELDSAVDSITKLMVDSFEKSCPLPKSNGKVQPHWWSSEIKNLMKETRKLRNAARGEKNPEASEQIWERYRTHYRDLKYLIRKSKRESWKNFCESLEGINEISRIRKIISKDPSSPVSITRDDGTWCDTNEQALDILLKTHFPGCIDADVNAELTSSIITISEELGSSDIIDREKIEWAIRSFQPFKAPGPDGIYPKMMQSVLKWLLPWFEEILKKSLISGHIPNVWKSVRVTFIPKAGKVSHTTPKDYRPISLSSFFLKTMERILEIHIRQCIPRNLLSKNQHAYMKGRSTETALHAVVGCIEKGLKDKEYTLAAFLDIEGAFNNVTSGAIEEAMTDLSVPDTIKRWVMSMLSTRKIYSELGDSKIAKNVFRGTPQGGVISPLLWLMVVNRVLNTLDRKGITAVAYADDVVLMSRGKFLDTLSDLLTNGLNCLKRWADDRGLGVNSTKTELVLFTNRHKIPDFKKPILGRQELSLSDEAKYLGIILDRKLNWNKNMEERRKKAFNALYICKKFMGRSWGTSPKISHWLYTSVVRPVLTYGCLVWWTAIEKKKHITALAGVQRSAGLCITGALRSTPTAAIEIILDLKPIDLFIKNVAMKGAARLMTIGLFKQGTIGHSKITQHFERFAYRQSDYMLEELSFGNNFSCQINNREDWAGGIVVSSDDLNIYTDGSKMDCGTGAGVYSADLELAESIKLSSENTVFQAEIVGILNAARYIKERGICNKNISIYSDSQAAIKALSRSAFRSRIVWDCVNSLREIGNTNNVKIVWVPGHEGHIGNENADQLARDGSALPLSENSNLCKIPLTSVKNCIDAVTDRDHAVRWTSLSDCRISKSFWPIPDKSRSHKLLEMSRWSVQRITAIITGHNLLRKHAKRLGLCSDDTCRFCEEFDSSEDSIHIVSECRALERRRATFLIKKEDKSLLKFFSRIGCCPRTLS